jgi:DNA helicase-2/ATP-dependent DNA helicase PcrA
VAGQALDPENILAALDDEQRQVATALRGPVRVLAGAGTGKTRAITHRIAYGISTGTYSPERILALTFTQRAAGEMRTRLRELGAPTVSARTFHASALRQLNYFWPQITWVPAPRLVDGKGRPLAEAAATLGLKLDTASLRDVAAEVEWRKVNNLTLDAYALRAASRAMPGTLTVEQCIDVQRAYERIKDERSSIDFEDVLLLTAGLLEGEPRVALQVHEQYRFFVVDEFQDVSPLQHRLLELWRGDRTDVCVVGDASQTIYSFTGATSDYLLNFENEFPNAITVGLERNYRSSAPIVRVANELMRDRAGALVLQSRSQDGPVPTVSSFASDHEEAYGVAARIRADIDSGLAASDIAVLYRTNAQSGNLERALTEASVSYQVAGATRFFDLPDVKRALLALRGSAVNPIDEPLFKSVSDVMRALGWTQSAPESSGAVRAKWEALNAIVEMADDAPEGSTLREFTDNLQARADARHEPTMNAVTLASIHSVKGLEWRAVYIVGVAEGLIPISYATGIDAVAEERRLLYVALTRAEERLHLSWSASGSGHRRARTRSRFLAECGTNTLREVSSPSGATDR